MLRRRGTSTPRKGKRFPVGARREATPTAVVGQGDIMQHDIVSLKVWKSLNTGTARMDQTCAGGSRLCGWNLETTWIMPGWPQGALG